MERIREARRHNTVAGSAPPSGRRHRAAALRDSPEGSMEAFRLRDGAGRRERDRDLFDGNKRGRVEESEEDNSHRKSSLSGRVARPAPVDEIVGVAVPRKARSSSAKRSHEYWVSGSVSASPARRSTEAVSPATSNLSVGKKKQKGTLKMSKSSSESHENIEIEIAEVLYGLMKQSHTSKKESLAPNPSQKLESNNSNGSGESEQPLKRETPLQNLTSEKCEPSVEVGSVSMEIQKEVAEQDSLRLTIESGHRGRDGIEKEETIIMAKEESPSCSKFNDLHDPTMSKGTSAVLRAEEIEEKMSSDMKNPAMTSLERTGLLELKLEPSVDLSKETPVNEVVSVEVEEKKMKPLTIDLEEGQDRSHDGDKVSISKVEQDKKQQRLAEPMILKKEKTVLPSTSASTNHVPCWAKRLLPLGYLPSPLGSIDGNTGSSKAQPRKKRCTTHYHIARNIHLHQQFVEASKFRPAPAGSSSTYDTNPCNLGLMLPANPLQGDCVSVNVSSSHRGEGRAPGHTEKDKTSKEVDNVDRKQLVFQQAPQPAMVGNLQHGPAFFFPISQNQAAGAATSGVSKSTISINNASSSSNSAARAPPSSTPSPAGASSFSYPNIPANEASCLAYQMPISTPFGTTPAFIGAAPAQAMPFFNGSFYSPQMFHPSQLHQQQPVVLPATSGSSSSSHKKLQTQQPWGAQNNRSEMQIKHASDGNGNNGNKPRQVQQQSSNGGVELVPQAFTVSFASNGNNVAPNISFSAMAPPQAVRQGYQVIAAGQMAPQAVRHYQVSEGKSGKEPKAAASGQTLLFDNSARTLNFMSPPVIGNWPSSSISSAAVATITPIVSNSPNPQQHQLVSNSSAPLGAKFQNRTVIFAQTPNQINPFGQSQSPQWKMNSARNPASQAPSMASSSSSSRTQQGQNQISFGGAASVSESPPRDGNGNRKSRAASSSTPTSQQTDNAATRTAQKSSPVCGRNVPSILMSSRPRHLSELKN